MIIFTLTIIEKGDEILLAMKKRGHGAGWWNAYGGKPNEGEDIKDAAKRELFEESGLTANNIKERAKIDFLNTHNEEKTIMHVFEVNDFEGEPKETEEMAPQWFKKSEIPFDEMWDGDKVWLPAYLSGKNFDGRIVFDENHKLVEYEIREGK